jgi:hypothetical protein
MTGGTAELIFSPVPRDDLGWAFLFLPEGADTMREKYLPGRRWCPLPENKRP